MSTESSKKRKPKVIRSDGTPTEGKRNRSDTEQVSQPELPCYHEIAVHDQTPATGFAAVQGCI